VPPQAITAKAVSRESVKSLKNNNLNVRSERTRAHLEGMGSKRHYRQLRRSGETTIARLRYHADTSHSRGELAAARAGLGVMIGRQFISHLWQNWRDETVEQTNPIKIRAFAAGRRSAFLTLPIGSA